MDVEEPIVGASTRGPGEGAQAGAAGSRAYAQGSEQLCRRWQRGYRWRRRARRVLRAKPVAAMRWLFRLADREEAP